MDERLRPRAEADRISASHPSCVLGEVAPLDGGDAQDDARDHRRAEDKPQDVEEGAVALYPRIEERHPEPGEACRDAARRQYSARAAVPCGFAGAESGDELEGSEHAEQRGADDVHHHGNRLGEESRVVGRDGPACGKTAEPHGARHDWNGAESDERRRK
jgi:hypothetical protein